MKILHVCAAAAPAAVVLALIAARLAAAPADFVPWWNDEVVYWNEVASFAHRGFDTGYVTVNEQPAPAPFSRFGPHGPVFAVVYGLAAKITGWKIYSGFVINLVLVPAAAFVWLRVRRPRLLELAVPALFWPMVLLLPTNMQEPMHFAIAFLLAAATWRLLSGDLTMWTWGWVVPLLAIAALARPTWALMVLPLGWVRLRGASVLARAALVAAAGAALAAAQQVFAYLAAPFPGSIAYLPANTAGTAGGFVTALAGGVQTLAGRIPNTVRAYLDAENGDPVEVALRYTSLGISVLLLALVLRPSRSVAEPETARNGAALQAAVLALLPLVALVVATGYIEGFRDFRIVSPHLLYAVLVGSAATPVVAVAWGATLLAMPTYLESFGDLHRQRFAAAGAEIEAVRQNLAPVLAHDPDGDGWDNTLLVHVDLLRYPLAGVPPGISVSYALDWDDQPMPPRSRHLLLRPADEEAIQGRVRLQRTASTPIGDLYRNLDAR